MKVRQAGAGPQTPLLPWESSSTAMPKTGQGTALAEARNKRAPAACVAQQLGRQLVMSCTHLSQGEPTAMYSQPSGPSAMYFQAWPRGLVAFRKADTSFGAGAFCIRR